MKKRSLSFGFAIVFAAIGVYLLYENSQLIKDKYIVATTEIAPESAAIESKLKLTEDGSFLYNASQTQLQASDDFRSSCSGIEKQAIVLGCYTGQRVYLYDVRDKKLDGVREVTAAHELLHAAYERLSTKEQEQINKLLLQQSKNLKDKHVKDTLALYKNLSQNELFNEMHSIFGTELSSLQPELEDYYEKYFTDRAVVVGYSQKYQAVFKSLQNKADSLKAQLSSADKQKKAYEANLESLISEIQSEEARLAVLKRSDVEAYNSSVDSYNSKVALYNQTLGSYKALINEMNSLINQINSNVTEQNDLTKKLDSNYSPL